MIASTGFWKSETAHLLHVNSAPLAQWIVQYLETRKANPVYDFGCGLGFYLEKLRHAGFTNLLGYEGDPPQHKMFQHIVKQDLTVPFVLPIKGNCIFLEVAEHIPSEFEQVALNNVLRSCNDRLIMSWAVRGQSGFGHINCRNNDEVITRITPKGFMFLRDDTLSARKIDLNNAPWFRSSMMIFKKL